MPLQPQEFELALNAGLDMKSGPEAADPASGLEEVENLRWNQAGALEKRASCYSDLAGVPITAQVTIPSGGDYGTCNVTTLFTRRNEVCALTDNYGVGTTRVGSEDVLSLPNRSLTTGGAHEVAQYAPLACSVRRSVLERSQFGADQGGVYVTASALYGTTLVFAWIELREGSPILKYRAVDAETGKVVTPTAFVTLTGAVLYAVNACPYAVAGSEGVLITYAYATGVGAVTVRTVLWNAGTKTFAASSNLTTNSKYVTHCVAQNGTSGIYFAFTDNTSNVIKAHRGTVDAIAGGTSTVHTGTTTGTIPGCFALGSTQTLVASYDSTNVYAEQFGAPGGVLTAITAMTVGATEGFLGMTGAQLSGDTAVLWVNCYTSETWGQVHRVRSVDVDFATSTVDTINAEDVIKNAWLATAGFTYGGRAFVGVNAGELEPGVPTSVLVLRHTSQSQLNDYVRHDAIARVCHDRYFSPSVGVFGGFAAVSVSGTKAYLVLTGDPSEAQSAALGVHLPQTIFQSSLTFPDVTEGAKHAFPLPSAEYGGVSYLASGVLAAWDGDTFAEQAPHTVPRVFVDVSASGSTTTAQTMAVVAIWRWVDAQGNLHRTQPSEQDSVAVVTSKNIKVYVTAPPVTALAGIAPWQDLEPELYITEQGGSTFYLALNSTGEKLTYASEAWGGNFWVFENVQPGTSAARQLYSTGANGAEIVPEPPPAFRDLACIGDRLWGIDAEDPSRLWFTKPFSAGFAPEWSVNNTLRIGDDGIAIRDLGGFPIVFGAAGIHRISGVGPDETGAGFFEPASRLPYVTGCIDRLVCSTSQGIFFRGTRGLYLLEPSLALRPVGLQVDELLRVPSSAGYAYARIVEDVVHNEVLVIDEAGGNLCVFNTLEQKWSTWTQDAEEQYLTDAVVADGRLWYLHADGSVRRVQGVEEADNGNTEGWSLRTRWIKPDGLNGQGKLWRIHVSVVLPNDPADMDELSVDIWNDFAGTVAQTQTWTGTELRDTWGAGQVARLPIIPAQQVVTAFRVRVRVTQTLASPGPRPLSARFQYGIRPSKGKRTPGVKM